MAPTFPHDPTNKSFAIIKCLLLEGNIPTLILPRGVNHHSIKLGLCLDFGTKFVVAVF
jgi:hypothetical protein